MNKNINRCATSKYKSNIYHVIRRSSNLTKTAFNLSRGAYALKDPEGKQELYWIAKGYLIKALKVLNRSIYNDCRILEEIANDITVCYCKATLGFGELPLLINIQRLYMLIKDWAKAWKIIL